jgi:hypothetical protein
MGKARQATVLVDGEERNTATNGWRREIRGSRQQRRRESRDTQLRQGRSLSAVSFFYGKKKPEE